MARKIEFYYDFGSPNAYLAWRALKNVPGLKLDLKPVLLGGIFKDANNQPPWQAFGEVPAKMRYLTEEIARFVRIYGLDEYKFNPNFPVMTVLPMRVATAALMDGTHDAAFEVMMWAMWEDGRDISKPPVLAEVLAGAGLDGEALIARAGEQSVKDALKSATGEAVMRGVFGIPTWFATNTDGEDEMFFGKENAILFGAKPVNLP